MKALAAIQRLLLCHAGLLLVLALPVLAQQASAADLELQCPCAIDSNGPTSMSITAGVRNLSVGGTSGSLRLRVIAHATPSFYDSSFNYVGNIQLPGTLAGGTQYPIAVYETGYKPPTVEIRHYTLLLEEYGGSGWEIVDSVRMQQRARSIAGAGGATGHVFFDGRAAAAVEGGQVSIDLPTIKNVSLGTATGGLTVEIWQKNAGGAYLTQAVSTIPLGVSLPAQSQLPAQTIVGPYSEFNITGFDYFDVVLLGGGAELANQRVLVRNGTPEQRYFALDSIDLLSDDDNDTVSNYNESLAGTDSGDENDTPGNAVVRVMVYYSDELPPLYSNDPLPRIEHLIDLSNQVLEDSGVAVTLELAKTHQVTLAANVTNVQILNDMRDEVGVFANLSTTRKTELVDVVLVMQPYRGDGNCGYATLGGFTKKGDMVGASNSESANGAISITGSCSDTSTIHELGHILGLGHSRAQGSVGTFDWSLGHGTSGQFVTIMPYSGFFAGASEVALFSTPLLDCLTGQPCGIDRSNLASGADAAFSINTVSHQVAAYTRDSDGDGTADALDSDDDGDGTPDSADEVPLDPNDVTDTDLDGIGNSSDLDDDGDGLTDAQEGTLGSNPLLWDTDSDGVKDDQDAFVNAIAASLDADEDGLPDAWNPGCNTVCQIASGLTLDDDPLVAECPEYVCRPFNRGWRSAIFQQAN